MHSLINGIEQEQQIIQEIIKKGTREKCPIIIHDGVLWHDHIWNAAHSSNCPIQKRLGKVQKKAMKNDGEAKTPFPMRSVLRIWLSVS